MRHRPPLLLLWHLMPTTHTCSMLSTMMLFTSSTFFCRPATLESSSGCAMHHSICVFSRGLRRSNSTMKG